MSDDKIPTELMTSYIECCFGYGNYDSDFRFIGPEPGGGATMQEASKRILCWNDRGRQPVEDNRNYHLFCGITEHHSRGASPQRTWRYLMLLFLAFKGEFYTDPRQWTKALSDYRINEWGRHGGETALLDLLTGTVETFIYQRLSWR